MYTFGKLVLSFGGAALLASPAWAQGRGGFGGGGAGFVEAPNVQKDLKLSDEQVGKVQQTLRDIRERHQADYSALRDASPEERHAKTTTLNETVSDEVKKALSFSAEQSKRFDQISLQARGVHAFASATVAEKLALTDEQKSTIREIVAATRASVEGTFNKDASQEEARSSPQEDGRDAKREPDQGPGPTHRRSEAGLEGTDRRADRNPLPDAAVEYLTVRAGQELESVIFVGGSTGPPTKIFCWPRSPQLIAARFTSITDCRGRDPASSKHYFSWFLAE